MLPAEELAKTPFHTLGGQETLEKLSADEKGLSNAEVEKRRETFGANKQPNRKNRGLWEIVLEQMKSPFIYVLIGAMFISFFLGEYTDGGFIAFVIVLNAGLGAYQEWGAEKNARKLANFMVPKAQVLRDGKKQEISAEDLVPGDIVQLSSGDKVPADLRLLSLHDLKIDESLLTGESDAVEKQLEALNDEKAPIGDQLNMAWSGAIVSAGRGKGVVCQTGKNTEMGKLSASLLSDDDTKPPLVQRMEAFSQKLSYIILGACLFVALMGFLQGMDLKEIFFLSVALAVSAIPEGLPISMTVALSVSQFRMFKRDVIVKQLTAVEGLGSCTAIASDKTGTLTVNKQTAKEVRLAEKVQIAVSGEGYDPKGQWEGDCDETAKNALLHSFLLPNEGRLEKEGDKWLPHGDAMDVASLVLGKKAGVEKGDLQAEGALFAEIPYESDLMYAAAFYEQAGEAHAVAKGALETLLPHTDSDHDYWKQQANELSDKGMRVLAGVAGKYKGQGDRNKLENYQLAITGLVGFIDPLRAETADAIQECKSAGVEVYMVTGDHPRTALSIGKQLGLAENDDQVLTGRELAEMSEAELAEKLPHTHVFARVSPLQKLELIDGIIDRGNFVAVTGDGANDAPALKKANIGVAMGGGTDMAKDASQLIIKNDDFKSIVEGIKEGRLAYNNIRKVVYLLVSTGMAEITTFLFSVIAGLPIPLSAVQILWLNVVTNGLQDKALSLEKGGPGLMQRKPRDPGEGIFDKHMIWQVCVAGITMGVVATLLFFYELEFEGMSLEEARNITLLTMVGLQNMHLLNARSEYGSIFTTPLGRNKYIPIAIVVTQGLHVACMYIPFMQEVLGVNPITLKEWGISISVSLSVILAVEIYKAILHLRRKKN